MSTSFLSFFCNNPIILNKPANVWARVFCHIALVRVSIKGLENIQKGTSYIFVANHQSAFDIFLIYGWLSVSFSWIMKKELRRIPFVGYACARIGHIFIDRSNPVEAKKSIANAKEVLQHGQCVVLFPEGTRTPTGKVGTFKRGAFSMASDLQLPIIPITIDGAFKVLNKKTILFTPGKIKMTIHKPIAITEKLSDTEIKTLLTDTREIIISGLSNN